MRDVINISLPSTLTSKVKKAVKSGQYASVSEFFRMLLRDWLNEEQLYKDVMESEKEFSAGKGKKLKSLEDLQ